MDDFKKYLVTFRFVKENEKSYTVYKKTKKTKKFFFVPKSVAEVVDRYEQENANSIYREKIKFMLPYWYCKKELGFYR